MRGYEKEPIKKITIYLKVGLALFVLAFMVFLLIHQLDYSVTTEIKKAINNPEAKICTERWGGELYRCNNEDGTIVYKFDQSGAFGGPVIYFDDQGEEIFTDNTSDVGDFHKCVSTEGKSMMCPHINYDCSTESQETGICTYYKYNCDTDPLCPDQY